MIQALHLRRLDGVDPTHLAAVDGGGTGTRLRLYDRRFVLLGEGRAGPSALSLGVEAAWQAIRQALAAAGGEQLPMAQLALAAGLSGAGPYGDAWMAAAPSDLALLALDNDGITTVLGAHGGQPGAVVAAGTGTVGMALRADGSRQMASGWGWRCGDEGSGAWLGLRAVQQAQQALDGRAPRGALADAVLVATGADRAALLTWIARADASAFASLAPLVFDSADAAASLLLDGAAAALADVARALDASLPLALAGSIALRLKDRLPPDVQARCRPPQGDSVDGALHLLRASL